MILPICQFFCKDNESPGESAGSHYSGRKNSPIFAGQLQENALMVLFKIKTFVCYG